MTWAAIAALAVGTYVLKAAGPLFFGRRQVPASLRWWAELVSVGVLAALIGVQVAGDEGRSLTVDARLVGLLVAAVAVWRRAPFIVVVLAACAATALARALS